MKKLVFAILLISSPAWAQTKLVPKSVTARVDNCAPIGRTADRQLVYSMKCDNLRYVALTIGISVSAVGARWSVTFVFKTRAVAHRDWLLLTALHCRIARSGLRRSQSCTYSA
jgi:hypothetical protein